MFSHFSDKARANREAALRAIANRRAYATPARMTRPLPFAVDF
jgi:hypothetical protein